MKKRDLLLQAGLGGSLHLSPGKFTGRNYLSENHNCAAGPPPPTLSLNPLESSEVLPQSPPSYPSPDPPWSVACSLQALKCSMRLNNRKFKEHYAAAAAAEN